MERSTDRNVGPGRANYLIQEHSQLRTVACMYTEYDSKLAGGGEWGVSFPAAATLRPACIKMENNGLSSIMRSRLRQHASYMMRIYISTASLTRPEKGLI